MSQPTQPTLGLSSHNNHYLFSDHYLNEILRRSPAWREAREPARALLVWLRELYEREQAQLPQYNESQLEDNWFKPILERLGHAWEGQASIPGLGGGIKKPDFVFFPDEAARHAAVAAQNTAAYAQQALAVGEVKAWELNLSKKTGGAPTFADNNPMFQIDYYLRAAGLEWGIISNGRFWRLVQRDSSYRLDTYFEIDLLAALQAPNETAAEATALYFWLFFRQGAFRSDESGRIFVKEALRQSRAYALALEADLRDNAYKALEQLILGFFAANGNFRIDNKDNREQVYRNSLYLLYRLLFLFYGESRGLLPMANPAYRDDYSLRALAEAINRRRNDLDKTPATGQRYWDRLRELFRLISGVDERLNADLGVPRYNGGLFEPQRHPFLERHGVGDRFLARAIDYLAYRRVREEGQFRGYQAVDYRTLGVRQLGSIYEGLLEYRVSEAEEEMVAVRKGGVETWLPAAQRGRATALERRQPGELYLATDKGERKATGSYYTPDYIVKYIVEQTLGPVVEAVRERVRSRGAGERESGGAGERGSGGAGQAAELFVEEMLALNVVDPAMGSGHFLVEATNFLGRALATDEHVQAGEEKPGFGEKPGFEEADLTYWQRRVVEACIYGVDKNEMAVELAKLSLWLVTVAADKPLSFLDHHLRHGDSLIGAWLEDLQRPPQPGGRAKAAQSEDGETQLALFDDGAFTRDAGLAVGGIATIEALPTESIEDVHAKERTWAEVQQTHLARWQRLADLWTSAYFGNAMSAAEHRALAARLQAQDSLMSEEQARQFLEHPAVVANDYFHWELEFPEVFFDRYGRHRGDAAGFDAVVGNPPYVRVQILRQTDPNSATYFAQTFASASGSYDLYMLMAEKCQELLSTKGVLGLILPNKFLTAAYGEPFRKLIAERKSLLKLIDFTHGQVFEGVTTYTCLLFLSGSEVKSSVYTELANPEEIKTSSLRFAKVKPNSLSGLPWSFMSPVADEMFARLEVVTDELRAVTARLFQGIRTSANDIYVLEDAVKTGGLVEGFSSSLQRRVKVEASLCLDFVGGDQIARYETKPSSQFVIFPYELSDGKVSLASLEKLERNFPLLYAYFRENRDALRARERGRLADSTDWYGYIYPKNLEVIREPKILTRDIINEVAFAFDEDGSTAFVTGYGITLDSASEYKTAYLLAILNSKFGDFALKQLNTFVRGGYVRIFTQYLEPIPIRTIDFETPQAERAKFIATAKSLYQQADLAAILTSVETELTAERTDTVHDLLAFLAGQMIAMNEEKQGLTADFWTDLEGVVADPGVFDRLRNKGKWEQSLHKAVAAVRPYVSAESRSTVNLDASLGWNEQAFKGFVRELTGAVRGLSDLVRVYRGYRPRYTDLSGRLAATDGLIDQVVYRLYGLSEEEVAIVAGES